MTLTPSTVRLDLKCGKGAIRQGQKCTKGAATKASVAENVLKYGGVLGAVGSLAYASRRNANIFGAMSGLQASLGASAAGVAMEGARTKDKNKQVLGTAVAAYSMLGAASSASYARNPGFFNERYGGGSNYKYQNYGQKGGTRPNQAVTDPFKDLGVDNKASDDEIKTAWKRLMRQHHPDAGGDPEKAKQVNAAYQEILRRRGRKDSVWADGFTIDWDSIWAQGFQP
jgi:DnaJ-domain-containing protein 1